MHVNSLRKVAIKKCIFHIQLVNKLCMRDSQTEDITNCGRFDNEVRVTKGIASDHGMMLGCGRRMVCLGVVASWRVMGCVAVFRLGEVGLLGMLVVVGSIVSVIELGSGGNNRDMVFGVGKRIEIGLHGCRILYLNWTPSKLPFVKQARSSGSYEKERQDCDDGSRVEENLVVASSDEEIVKFPTQHATTEISGEDGSNLKDFIDVLTGDEVDIT
ncbi:hypothetical protein Tco_0659739 [Tanacetum coccineum]